MPNNASNPAPPRLRIPLYGRILAWLVLNLLFLLVLAGTLFRLQFGIESNWLLTRQASDRIQALTSVLAFQLSEAPRASWTHVLQQYTDAYGMTFGLYGREATLLAGPSVPLPAEVRERLRERFGPPGRPGDRDPLPEPGPPHPQRPPDVNSRGVFPPPPITDGPMPPDQMRGGPRSAPKTLLRAGSPSRYWLITRFAIRNAERGRPEPVTLLGVASDLRAGGLLFDFTPWLIAAGIGLCGSIVLWFPLVRGITGSLARMTEATASIAEGHFDVRIDATRTDEIGQLAAAINAMAAKLQAQVQGQKRFMSDVAHELCAPIARTQAALGILEQRAQDNTRDYITDLHDEVQHMSGLVHELLAFSKASLQKGKAQLQPVLLLPLLHQAAEREGADSLLETELPPDFVVHTDPDLLSRALGNILRNALRHAPGSGPLRVTLSTTPETIQLRLADSGPGVPPESLPNLFEPFYRPDPSRTATTGGTGLGLAIVKSCIEATGGSVSCRNLTPRGFEVTLHFPNTTS